VYRCAIDYVPDRKERVPAVIAARVGRILSVYQPRQQLVLDEFLDLREKWMARTALSRTSPGKGVSRAVVTWDGEQVRMRCVSSPAADPSEQIRRLLMCAT
jgi:hypothetical protein